MQVSRDDLVFHAEIAARSMRYMRLGLDDNADLNVLTVNITDPFNNRLRFHQNKTSQP